MSAGSGVSAAASSPCPLFPVAKSDRRSRLVALRLPGGPPFCVPHIWPQWRCEGGCADRREVRRAESRGRSRWSSWWCRRQRSSCGTKPDGLPVRPWCGRQGRRPGSWSVPAETQNTSLFAISAITLLEVTAKPFPQLQPRPQQPRLDRRDAKFERLSRLLGRKTFHVSQNKDRAKARRQSLNRLGQDFLQFRLAILLFRIRTPIRDFAGNRIFLGLDVLVQRDHALRPTSPQLHQRFVDRNAHQPGIKLALALELIQIAVGLKEGILHHIFRVFAVLGDVLRNAKHIPVVAPDKFLKCRYISAFGGLNQSQLITDWFGYLLLDGCHSSSDATIFMPGVLERIVILLGNPPSELTVLTYLSRAGLR